MPVRQDPVCIWTGVMEVWQGSWGVDGKVMDLEQTQTQSCCSEDSAEV